MATNMCGDGFQFVKRRRNKKHRGHKHSASVSNNINIDGKIEDVDKEDVLRLIQLCRSDIENSNFMSDVKDILERIHTHLEKLHHDCVDDVPAKCTSHRADSSTDSVEGEEPYRGVSDLVCYGLGNFASCTIARYQLALLLLLRDELTTQRKKCYVFDPVFTQSEHEILRKLEFKILQTNEEGRRRVYGPTLLYMPHCGRALYNNLLWSNWNPELLSNVILIGNSFTDMEARSPSRIFKGQASYIHDILTYTTECPLKNSFRFDDIFNDLALHTFSTDELQNIEPAFWLGREQPEYDMDNVEIITNAQS